MIDSELKAALDGAVKLSPPSSKRPLRQPLLTDFLKLARAHLDLSLPLDAAVFACLTTSFFSLARLGEMTVTNLSSFAPAHHPKRTDLRIALDRNGLEVQVCHLPRTKVCPNGEDIYWASQDPLFDPRFAMANHLHVNDPHPDHHLFAWLHPKGNRPLTRSEFLRRLAPIANLQGLDALKGHSIRIGGTLEFLLRGTPFEAVKSLGRWSSDAFHLYLRRHAVILAPYIQTSPVMEEFTRITIPPPR